MTFFIRDKNTVYAGLTGHWSAPVIDTDEITPTTSDVKVVAFTTRHAAQMQIYNISAIDTENRQWTTSNNLDFISLPNETIK
jgi:hypothetical protein